MLQKISAIAFLYFHDFFILFYSVFGVRYSSGTNCPIYFLKFIFRPVLADSLAQNIMPIEKRLSSKVVSRGLGFPARMDSTVKAIVWSQLGGYLNPMSSKSLSAMGSGTASPAMVPPMYIIGLPSRGFSMVPLEQ